MADAEWTLVDAAWEFAVALHRAGRRHADVDEFIVAEELRRAEVYALWRRQDRLS